MYVCVCIYMPLPRGFQNKKVFVLLTPVFNFSRDYRFYCYLMFLFFFFRHQRIRSTGSGYWPKLRSCFQDECEHVRRTPSFMAVKSTQHEQRKKTTKPKRKKA